MSKKSQLKLTENGVLALYERKLKNEVQVQVIFLTKIDSLLYMRVSDGQRLSPVLLMEEESDNYDKYVDFNVGAIIVIKERKIVTQEEYSEHGKYQLYLEDTALHLMFIERMSVVAGSDEVGSVLGSLCRTTPYQENMAEVINVLKQWDDDDDLYGYDYNGFQAHIDKMEGDRLRERGNGFFKQEFYEDAIMYYDMAKTKDPFDYRVWVNGSLAHYRMEKYLFAELHALIAMKLNPFFEKTYYRAGQAAIKDHRRFMGELYAKKGIFLCGETRDLLQVLEDAAKIPYDDGEDDQIMSNLLTSILTRRLRANPDDTCATGIDFLEMYEKKNGVQNGRLSYSEQLRRKIMETQRSLLPKNDVKKVKKNKKPAFVEGLAAALKEQKKSKEEEEKKPVQEFKKEEKNHKPKINLQEALEEGQRLFQCDQFHQAIVMYDKCLTLEELRDNTKNKGKSKLREVQVIHFIIGMCKVQGSRAFIYEGLETMQTLYQDNSKFTHKPVAGYWLAVSFEKICCFNLAEKQAHLCNESIKKIKSLKPINWPGTDQPIKCTTPEEYEKNCKSLLARLSTARPTPRATCRYKNCITTQGVVYAKQHIYLEDPDFKGYLNIVCEEDCIVSYHPCCWKAFKDQRDTRMSDKDYLGEVCVTPDCYGKISNIQIFDDSGEMKNKVMKDKKDKKNMPPAGKQKKKKDKKKEKVAVHKKRTRVESTCEDQTNNEESSSVMAESSSALHNTATNSTNNTDTANKNPRPVLPIDIESLETAHITVLKPGMESEQVSPSKAAKKSKKKKAKKPASQTNLLADPLEDELCVQNEYMSRLRQLRQQRDALEAGELPNPMKPITSTDDVQHPVMLLDPDNPFYLPQHLRDNPEELENVLQNKLTSSSPPGLQQDTINTLLDFMYDWLKSEGPMHTSDARLGEQVAENFPQEAKEYVSQCGGITGLLMQSIKFAMIDGIVCVHDDVMKAQEMVCREVNDKMIRSTYLVRFSDGQKAKRYTHLLDDAKSTCSTASSSSYMAGSVAESAVSSISRDSARPHNAVNLCDDHNNNSHDIDNTNSLAPLSRTVVNHMNKFTMADLNRLAMNFVVGRKSEDKYDDEEDEEDDEETEIQWNKSDDEYVKNWAAKAGAEVPLMPDEEDDDVEDEEEERRKEEETNERKGDEELEEDDEEKEEEDLDEEEEEEDDEKRDEEKGEELEEEEMVEEEEEEETVESVRDEAEEREQYISQLQEEKEELTKSLEKEQQQNQKLSDKLYQVKSQTKSEVMKLRQQVEELKELNNELSTEKNSVLAQKDADVKKYKTDLSRNTEEMKTHQSRLQSVELKCERYLDQNNELKAKLVESHELNTQLKDELLKMQNLQESLTSCSRRAREAEVKYLTVKKELVDASMTRTITRLTEESTAMKRHVSGATNDSLLDRNTLTRTILAWDEAVKTLKDQQQAYKEESTRLLGMIHQGRPLSALPDGDLVVPAFPNLIIAPLLGLLKPSSDHLNNVQNNHQSVSQRPSLLGVPEGLVKDTTKLPSPGPPPVLQTSSKARTEPPPPQVPQITKPLVPAGTLNGHPGFMRNGVSNPGGGAIPKTTSPVLSTSQPANTPEVACLPQKTDSPNQLFVGQLPWDYTDADVKNLFSRFGEVVSMNIYDKGQRPDGKAIPKYGFITFRNAEDCTKALTARPIYVRNHMLNVQATEPKKPTKPPSLPATVAGAVGGCGGDGGAGGGGGLVSVLNELDASNGVKSSVNGLTNTSVSSKVEVKRPAAAHPLSLPTPPTLHQHQPPPPPISQSITKPKFQRLLPTNTTAGAIVAPPPKLVRPQSKAAPNTTKTGQTSAVKEENAMPMSASYTRLIDICKQRFGKEFSSPDICTALREVRAQNNNSLSGLNTEKIVERVKQQLRNRRPAAPATVAPWAGITQGSGVKTEPEWKGPNKKEVLKEESCSICLEPLNTKPNQSLACLHTFHELCINDWLKIQSSCPNCRKLALMPDEYPRLPHS